MIFIDGRFVAGDEVDNRAYEILVTFPDAKRSTAIMAIKISTNSRDLRLLVLTNFSIVIASSWI